MDTCKCTLRSSSTRKLPCDAHKVTRKTVLALTSSPGEYHIYLQQGCHRAARVQAGSLLPEQQHFLTATEAAAAASHPCAALHTSTLVVTCKRA